METSNPVIIGAFNLRTHTNWTMSKPCHDPEFAQCGCLLHIRNQNPKPYHHYNLLAPLLKGLFKFDSSDNAAATAGQFSIGIVLSRKTEWALP